MGGSERRKPALPADATDLHIAYMLGHSVRLLARRGEKTPGWAAGLDPLETLFLGAAWPDDFEDVYRFSNACDTWLRVLRCTPYWEGIERFVREALALSRELGVPAGADGADALHTPLREWLEAARRELRDVRWALPWGLLPAEILRGARCLDGPPRDIRLPEPPPDAGDLAGLFWAAHEAGDSGGDGEGTASGGMLAGLRTLRAAGALGVKDHQSYGSIGLLKGLFAGLVPRTGRELPTDLVNRAIAWALGLPPESPLVGVVDVLLISVERGLETEETLGRLFGVRAFGRAVSAADREWRSSPGTALRRVARELGQR